MHCSSSRTLPGHRPATRQSQLTTACLMPNCPSNACSQDSRRPKSWAEWLPERASIAPHLRCHNDSSYPLRSHPTQGGRREPECHQHEGAIGCHRARHESKRRDLKYCRRAVRPVRARAWEPPGVGLIPWGPRPSRGKVLESSASRRCTQIWAMRIKRVYEIDPLACPECGG